MIPLFKSHYSIGRSILTLDPPNTAKSKEADSILDLAIINKISPIVLLEDSMSGCLEAYTNFTAAKICFIFGLRLFLVNRMDKKDEESLKQQHKIVIFIKNLNGYKRLVKISSLASIKGFYYEPRIDISNLSSLWSNDDLCLAIPFYDSFIWNNVMYGHICIPDFNFAKPVFFIEDNNLPFDSCISHAVRRFAKDDYAVLESKSIYYAKKIDFINYLAFRCINNRTTLNEPEVEHCSSNEFCVESFIEKQKRI